RQHEPGSSAGDGHNPGVPSPALYGGVRYARSIRRKGGAHLGKIVVSELERLSIGQQLYIDLSTTLEGILSADKRKQAAVRGQRGGSCGIGEVRQRGEVAQSAEFVNWVDWGTASGDLRQPSIAAPATSSTTAAAHATPRRPRGR